MVDLTQADWDVLKELNARIQAHTGEWGSWSGGQELSPGVHQMPYANEVPLVSEFLHTWYRLGLVLMHFDWPGWDEGRRWYANPDPAKYDQLGQLTALKLLTAVIRNDRFNEGALMGAFESGDFPKIINQSVRLQTK